MKKTVKDDEGRMWSERFITFPSKASEAAETKRKTSRTRGKRTKDGRREITNYPQLWKTKKSKIQQFTMRSKSSIILIASNQHKLNFQRTSVAHWVLWWHWLLLKPSVTLLLADRDLVLEHEQKLWKELVESIKLLFLVCFKTQCKRRMTHRAKFRNESSDGAEYLKIVLNFIAKRICGRWQHHCSSFLWRCVCFINVILFILEVSTKSNQVCLNSYFFKTMATTYELVLV